MPENIYCILSITTTVELLSKMPTSSASGLIGNIAQHKHDYILIDDSIGSGGRVAGFVDFVAARLKLRNGRVLDSAMCCPTSFSITGSPTTSLALCGFPMKITLVGVDSLR